MALVGLLAAGAVGLWAAGQPASALGTGLPAVNLPPTPTLPVRATPTPTPLPSASLSVPGVVGAAPAPALPGGTVALPATSPPPPTGGTQAPAPAGSQPGSGAADFLVADSFLTHLAFSDPFLAAQVSAIVANPVAPQPPDLRHLAFVSAGWGDSGVVPAGTAAARRGGECRGRA